MRAWHGALFRPALPVTLLAALPCLIAGCGGSGSAPLPLPASATQAATVPGALAEATTLPSSTTLPALTEPSDADIGPIPPLEGNGIVTKMPDGQLWAKYPNGIAYQNIKNGASLEPAPGQTVYIFFKAYNAATGEQFDQNPQGRPYHFRLGSNSVPEGLNIAVYNMQRDGRKRWWIPPNLAFGDKGIPGKLPPDTPVIYDITLQQWEGHVVHTLNLRTPDLIGPSAYLGPKSVPSTGPSTGPGTAPPPSIGPSGPPKP
ncbi:MAG TPA: FKBP-type peptidyl-prolyl cis-trans isomerase [Phycisphaerae bacterium]|nr:FKBP-type peptidyl-prolyl cis-trans isomerase [Phycisphaerae bacterium]